MFVPLQGPNAYTSMALFSFLFLNAHVYNTPFDYYFKDVCYTISVPVQFQKFFLLRSVYRYIQI